MRCNMTVGEEEEAVGGRNLSAIATSSVARCGPSLVIRPTSRIVHGGVGTFGAILRSAANAFASLSMVAPPPIDSTLAH